MHKAKSIITFATLFLSFSQSFACNCNEHINTIISHLQNTNEEYQQNNDNESLDKLIELSLNLTKALAQKKQMG